MGAAGVFSLLTFIKTRAWLNVDLDGNLKICGVYFLLVLAVTYHGYW